MNDFLFLFILLILSGFFSGAEIALFSLGAEKIKALKNNAKTTKQLVRVTRLENLKAEPQKLLVTILVGNNIVNVAASSIATLIATTWAQAQGITGSNTLIIGSVTGVMTLALLIFGEITPKSLAHKHAAKFSLAIAPIIQFLQLLLTPVVLPLSKIVEKFAGDDELRHGLSEDELKAALELSEQDGQIEKSEKEWVEKILEFGNHTVENVMTPRSKIFGLADDTTAKNAIKAIQETKFSRIPIFHEDLDNITGILNVHGLLEKVTEPDFFELKVANLPVTKAFKIPITMKIDTLLESFQTEKTHMALVLDEHGGLVGLITLEDVLEEIFGEIQDEQDEEAHKIHQIGKRTFSCLADAQLEHLEEFICEKLTQDVPEQFPWSLKDENKTLGLLMLEKLERFPEKNESITLRTPSHFFTFKVTKVENERILKITVTLHH